MSTDHFLYILQKLPARDHHPVLVLGGEVGLSDDEDPRKEVGLGVAASAGQLGLGSLHGPVEEHDTFIQTLTPQDIFFV